MELLQSCTKPSICYNNCFALFELYKNNEIKTYLIVWYEKILRFLMRHMSSHVFLSASLMCHLSGQLKLQNSDRHYLTFWLFPFSYLKSTEIKAWSGKYMHYICITSGDRITHICREFRQTTTETWRGLVWGWLGVVVVGGMKRLEQGFVLGGNCILWIKHMR